ncbi:MAG TPA: FadR/GntR family transcriptional regulator [Candidatus Acidoferrales bacterium]|nr:FadR/GntR family transcriptional regulator [Candidatus Acidoferrales bacterium]
MANISRTRRVIDFIFDYIRENELSIGAALPSELRTSTQLAISRSIVREAFRSLEVAGIIEKENGRAPRVGPLNSSFLTHLLVHALSTKQISVKQVLALRSSVEVSAAQEAAKRRTRSDILRLREATAGMRRSIKKPEAFVLHDLDFHDLINRASGNPLVELICEAMHECMQESMRVGLLKRRSQRDVLKVVEIHEAIADAIAQGNAAKAGMCMSKHFEDTQRVFSHLDENEVPAPLEVKRTRADLHRHGDHVSKLP